jgi:hypothetical protein
VTTTTEPTTAEDTAKAANIVDTNGLNKGFLYDETQAEEGAPRPECRVDIIGAVNVAVCGQPLLGLGDVKRMDENIARAQAVYTAVARHLDIPVATLTDWSDAKGRQKRQVAKALRDTAAGLRAGGAA